MCFLNNIITTSSPFNILLNKTCTSGLEFSHVNDIFFGKIVVVQTFFQLFTCSKSEDYKLNVNANVVGHRCLHKSQKQN